MKDLYILLKNVKEIGRHETCKQGSGIIKSVIYRKWFWKQGKGGMGVGIWQNDKLGDWKFRLRQADPRQEGIKEKEWKLKKNLGVDLKDSAWVRFLPKAAKWLVVSIVGEANIEGLE